MIVYSLLLIFFIHYNLTIPYLFSSGPKDKIISQFHINGSLMGKDRYKQLYQLTPGDLFDHDKHISGISRIKQALKDAGYFDPVIDASYIIDTSEKYINIKIDITPGLQYKITDIHIQLIDEQQGYFKQNNLSMERLRKFLKKNYTNEYYSKQLIDMIGKKINEFFNEAGFFSLMIRKKEMIIHKNGHIKLVFSTHINSKNYFICFGNYFFTKKELLDQISLFRGFGNSVPPSIIIEHLITLYKDEGFLDVKISGEDDNSQTIFFIEEGNRYQITEIEIKGIHYFTKDWTKKLCKKYVQNGYSFKETKIRAIFDDIIGEYGKNGFWNCTISAHTLSKIKKYQYRLIIKIDEGKQKFLHSININCPFDQEIKHCLNHEKIFIPLDINAVNEQRKFLTHFLHKKGYLSVYPHPELTGEDHKITLTWNFIGDPSVVTFGKTVIKGSGKIDQKIFEREFTYKPGDVWDQYKIYATLSRLKSLGIFSSITLVGENIDQSTHIRPLLLKYEEDDPYEIRFRLGIQSVNRNIIYLKKSGITYKTGASLLFKNPGNKADMLSLNFEISRFKHNGYICYTIPWLGNYPIKTEIKGSSVRYEQPFLLGCTDILYHWAQDDISIACSYNIDWGEFGIKTSIETVRLTPSTLFESKNNNLAFSQTVQLDTRLINTRIMYYTTELSLFNNGLDNKINPLSGSLFLSSLKSVFCRSPSLYFLKWIGEYSFFYTKWYITHACRLRLGNILGTPLSRISPLDRFYLGGPYSVRSYEPDLVPPLNIMNNQNTVRCVPIGSTAMVNLNYELRFPLYHTVQGIIFFDMGHLFHDYYPTITKNMVYALGWGIRLNTIVGPLRFDIGWKLSTASPYSCNQELIHKPYAWCLSLGNAF